MVKSFKKAIAILVSVLMIATSLPFTALTASAATSSQVFGYVEIDPILYTHGTFTGTHSAVGDPHHMDYAMYGTRVADGTYDGECKTAVTVNGKTVSSISIMESGATLSINDDGYLTGDVGNYFSGVTESNDSIANIKFNFNDGTYEIHQLPVKSNPVATHTLGSLFAWCQPFATYRYPTTFKVVAKGSYGQTSNSSNKTNSFSMSSTSNHNGTTKEVIENYQSLYGYNQGLDSWEDGQTVYMDSMTNEVGAFSKKAGYYVGYTYKERAKKTMNMNSLTANYYIDMSSNKNYGVNYNKDDKSFSLKMYVGSVYWNDDQNNGSAAMCTNTVSKNGNSEFPTSAALDSNISSNINIRGNSNGYATINGKAAVGTTTADFNLGYRNKSGDNCEGTLNINTKINLVVTDKSELRNYYNSLITSLKNGTLNPTCYTQASWDAFITKLLAAEKYLNDNTDTSSVTDAKATLTSAYDALVEEHDFEETTPETKATCKAGGVSAVMTCKNCGKTTGGTATEKDPTNHTNIVDIAAVAPTCGKDGTTAGKKCNDCGTVTVEPQVDPATGNHTPGEETGAITKPATKTEEGEMTYTIKCTVCENVISTRTEPIPVVADTAKTVTFVINGENVEREVNVGETPVAPTYNEKEADADYHYTYAWDKEFTEVTAEDENITYTLIETPVAHTPVTDEAQAPTHYASGLTEGSHCSVCNYVIVAQQVDPQIEHSYTLDTTSEFYVAADCENPGMDVFVCSCGDSYKQPTSSLGHTPADAVKENLNGVDENGDLLNCEIAGSYKSVVYCSQCDDVISSETVIVDAIGHTNTVVVVDPTCTEDGYKYEKCSTCGYINPTNIPVTPFVIDSEEYAYPSALYNAVGNGNSQDFNYTGADAKYIDHLVIKFNENCNIYYNSGTLGIGSVTGTLKVYDIGGNQVASFKQKEAANAEVTVPGTYARLVLSNANSNTYGYSIDSITAVPKLADGESADDYKALGHDYSVDLENGYAATCTTDGKNTDMQCSRCDAVQTGTTIDKLGHSFTNYIGNNDAVEATCITEGMTESETATCDREGCDVTDTIESVSTGLDADNHEGPENLRDVVAPTASKDGYTGNMYCDACNTKTQDGTVAPAFGDYSAYNSAVANANTLVETEYTVDSWADLQTALADAKTIAEAADTQNDIDDATSMIETAINSLEKIAGLKVTVNVQIDGEDTDALEFTDLSYGDPIHIDLTGKLADASIQKWTIEQANAITKLSMTDKTYDMVVTANATITVYATADKTEEDPSYTKVKFTDRGYRTIGYGYVSNTSQIDLDNITPIEGANIVAPTIAFYNFAGWEEVARNVYVATYEVIAHDVCNVKTDVDTIEVNGSKSDLVDYDTNIAITYTGTKPLGIKIGDKVMPITDLANVHAPYGYEMVEIVEIDDELAPTSMITGKFTRDGDAGKTIAAFNAMYYLPEDCTLVECGVYAKKGETFDVSTLNTATKVRSQSQSSNNEYTISMQSNYAADGVTKVYGMSYVTYKTAGGEIITAYGDLAVINV